MAAQWHYSKGGERHGPVSSDQLRQLAASGQLGPTDLVWRDGMAEWQKASSVKGLFPRRASGPGEPPPIPQSQPHHMADPAPTTPQSAAGQSEKRGLLGTLSSLGHTEKTATVVAVLTRLRNLEGDSSKQPNSPATSADKAKSPVVAMKQKAGQLLCLSVLLLACTSVSNAEVQEITARVGPQQTIFPDKYLGFRSFPDEAICVLSLKPFTFLMVGCQGRDGETFLWRGRTLNEARPVKKVLALGNGGSFDANYAGINSIYYWKTGRELLGFYHAEDFSGMTLTDPTNGFGGSYWTIALAVSRDNCESFSKIGQIITGPPKGSMKIPIYGAGLPSVCADPTGQYLFAYYHTHAHFSVCMARSLMSEGGRPGTWHKYYNGKFDQPGLGGKDTPILPNAFLSACPSNTNVQYMDSFKKYVMVVAINAGNEMPNVTNQPRAEKSGMYFCYSDDGIKWSVPQQLFACFPVPVTGHEMATAPSLYITRSNSNSAQGYFLYGYTSRFGFTPPNETAHLAMRSIQLTVGKSSRGSQEAEVTKRRTMESGTRSPKVDRAGPLPVINPGQGETTTGTPLRSTQAEKTSVETLRDKARSSNVNASGEVVALDFSGVRLTNEDLSALGGIRSLRNLTLPKTGLSDSGLEQLSNLTQLSSLGIWGTNVTDEGFKHIGQLTNLSYLSVEGNRRVTSDGLRHLTGLRRLSWLGLSHTGVSDDGIPHVAKLPSLTRLDLNHTAITDGCLEAILKMKNLKTLGLKGTMVTEAGVARLRRGLPNCEVNR